MKANGTVAKDIALYFLDETEQRYTKSIIAKTINQAKQLLEAGYTQEEIEKSIDWVVNKTNVKMYSLGYINTMINMILDNIKEEEEKEETKMLLKKAKKEYENMKCEVKEDDKSSQERNKRKLDKFGDESRFGKKFDFDLFEEPREDN